MVSLSSEYQRNRGIPVLDSIFIKPAAASFLYILSNGATNTIWLDAFNL